MFNYRNKNATIFGFGISGKACAKCLLDLEAIPFITEIKPTGKFAPDEIAELDRLGIKYEFGGHSEQAVNSTDLIVVSPGIHLDIPVLLKAKSKNIPVIAEIELAYWILNKPIIAVTGTNGKTTTTTLIGEMLKAAGKKIAVAGNIGAPLIAVDDRELDYIAAETSSYQLEGIKTFRPYISVICNIQEDHIERHHSMEEYIVQKARIFENQTQNDFVVYNDDDPLVRQMVISAKAQKIPFSKTNLSVLGVLPDEIKIPGRHNLENALAAATAVSLCSVSKEVITQVLRTFPGVEHRIEFVREINSIRFFNDSKATNPASTLVALETFIGKPLILILGGREKGVEIDTLCQKVKEGVRQVILIGEAAELFKRGLDKAGFSSYHIAGSMEEAVKLAYKISQSGDNLVLSPACASFDMFKNYEERGKAFKEAIYALTR
ncbi:MAG: UDP-N-acetylmuramoyl-L-alanine--D-glutamate ligase [Candidatus Margulisbacteria bacterium]|nr:UDP-N-acetylmuramoyl-L-alanine--D-glutamate ligase [Candidatus Margulisiibacteriota bacterium]